MHAGAERLTFRSCFHIIEISKFVLNIHRPIVHISHVTVQRRMHMTADTWFVIHLFGVFITFVLLVIVVSKDDPSYKSELSLTIACCLVALVAKSIYIAGGSEEMLVAVGKMEYLGKSFANYCALLFLIRWRNLHIPRSVTRVILVVNACFYIMIVTVDFHHLYYKRYWMAPSKVNLCGYGLEIEPAPLYYAYMLYLVLEIAASIAIIVSSYMSKRSMPYRGRLHLMLIAAMLSPMILLTFRLLGILKGDDPTPLGILLSCIFMCIAVVKYRLFDPVSDAKKHIIENLNEALIVTDSECRFLFTNPMADSLISIIKEDTFLYPDRAVYEKLKSGDGYLDLRGHHYQVEETPLESDHYTQGYLLTIVDITDLMEQNKRMKELVAQAEAANRAKSTFVSNMSHEIRTPMNSIVGITEIMLRTKHSQKDQEYLLNIRSSGQALLTIVNDVLDFSKIESGKITLLEEAYDVLSLFHDLRMTMQNRIGSRPLKLIFDIDQDIPCMLKGDMGRIRQVVINLVNNAIKYTEEGHVKFTVRILEKTKDHIQLYFEVEDTGIGIRKEDQKIMFDSFRRVDMDRNRRIEGTGLGLTISKNFVTMMGGSIGVDSEYGKGSRFFFQIPQEIVDPQPISVINYESRHQNVLDAESVCLFTAPYAHILLVDDNALNLTVAKDLFAPLQMQIDTAENGRQALEMVQKKHYDLVLMDHMMPVMNGIDATKAIRKLPDPYYQDLPVIALTANAMTDARKEFDEAGMNGFIAKPIIFRNACSEIRKWLPKELIHDVSPKEARKLLADVSGEEMSSVQPDQAPDADSCIFHYEEGLQYCGSEATLLKSIQIFYRTIDRNAMRIEQFLQEGLLEDYTIEVHALKNSAQLIGVPALSAASMELEAYGSSGNEQALIDKTPAMLAMYRSLKPILLPYIKEDKNQNEVTPDTWIAVLGQLHDCMEQFDTDRADEIMEQLEEFVVPECLKDSMEQLRILVDDIAMEDVMKLTTDMITILKQEQGGKHHA